MKGQKWEIAAATNLSSMFKSIGKKNKKIRWSILMLVITYIYLMHAHSMLKHWYTC